jgi:RimJ/RimL family protein N-acetyltransferase
MSIATEIIRSSRLTLVPLRAGHADEMADVLADPDLYAFTGGSPPSVRDLRTRYERWVAGSPDPAVSWCNWVIQLQSPRCLAGTVQATIGAVGVGVDQPSAEIAWVVRTRWQGRGLATEAARALVGWLQAQSVSTVVAHIHPRHLASAAVAAAAGLTPTDDWHDGERMWTLTITAEPGRRQ